jgi:hypothetical protein
VDQLGVKAREAWSAHGWGGARAEREAKLKRSNLALGAVAGLGLGAGAAYFILRRRRGTQAGYLRQASHTYYTGNGSSGHDQPGAGDQYAVDRAMRSTETAFDNTTGSLGLAPAREFEISRDPVDVSAGIGMENRDATMSNETDGAWIVIPKEQWAEFIQKISDSHVGWTVTVENEGNLSPDQTPVEETRFEGMQLEPSMARPGVRMFVGHLPEGFFEHVIPDLRTLEHQPSDEEGYQGLRLTTTVDRVTIRFTGVGDAKDPLAE